MIFVWILLIAVVSYANGARIVGGDPTTIERYPGIVQVEFRTGILWSQSCAANVLNNVYVLSAAHCFDGLLFTARNRRIRAGTTNRNWGGTVIRVSSVVNHPSYSSSSMDGDISVIRLQSALTYGANIQQIPISIQGFLLPDNLPVVHAGWGTTSSGGLASAVLRDVTIFTIDNELCRDRYLNQARPQFVTENMICAGILDVGGKDACQGDSGGPLYYDGILVGIVSWGRGCADATFPGVSARVSSYTDWIITVAV